MDPAKQPGILIGQILLEQAEFSHREDFLSLPPTTPIERASIGLEIQVGYSPDRKHGLVRIRAHSNPTEKPLYNVDAVMTALIQVDKSQPNMPIEQYLTGHAPAMLYPFVRQAVADLTGRGRFGPLWLSPLNLKAVAHTAMREVAEPQLAHLGKKAARVAKKRRRK